MLNWGYKESAHSETAGQQGFTGEHSWQRMKAAGYQGKALGECMSFGDSNGPSSVSGLVRVPYHRIPFVQGSQLDIGIGKAQDIRGVTPQMATTWVYNFGGVVSPIVVWPPDGAKDVRPSGSVFESPDPMEIHGVGGHGVGYVLTASFDQSNLQFRSASLADADGTAVPLYINHPGNDKNSSKRMLLIPKGHLRSNASYRASISLSSPTGRHVEKTWTFTTGSEAKNFEYVNALSRYPATPDEGRRYRGVVAEIANDDTTITISELADASAKTKTPSKVTRTFRLTPESKLRHAIDPLGLDYDRANPAKGARVIFTARPGKPETLHELLVLK